MGVKSSVAAFEFPPTSIVEIIFMDIALTIQAMLREIFVVAGVLGAIEGDAILFSRYSYPTWPLAKGAANGGRYDHTSYTRRSAGRRM